MARGDRLFKLMRILRDGRLHRARDLARRLRVSERTIYRDMDRLMASGVPVSGSRGVGYRATSQTALPPLDLTAEELEALNLGIAIVSETHDPDLRRAVQSLAAKIDGALAEQGADGDEAWRQAVHPFADPARVMVHMAPVRAAVRGRQKLAVLCRTDTGEQQEFRVRPLSVDYWGRVWTLTAWCESGDGFRDFRIDLIERVTPLPELFTDEPGKRLADLHMQAGRAVADDGQAPGGE